MILSVARFVATPRLNQFPSKAYRKTKKELDFPRKWWRCRMDGWWIGSEPQQFPLHRWWVIALIWSESNQISLTIGPSNGISSFGRNGSIIWFDAENRIGKRFRSRNGARNRMKGKIEDEPTVRLRHVRFVRINFSPKNVHLTFDMPTAVRDSLIILGTNQNR